MEVEMKIRGLMMDPVTNMPIVILKDVGGNSVLPIWVGVYEANAIALEIEKVSTPRPMTHDLIKTLLLGLETGVRKVVVSELKDDTFYAVIWLDFALDSARTDIASDDLEFAGGQVRIVAGAMRLIGSALSTVFDRVTHFSKHHARTTEGLDRVHAAHLELEAQQLVHISAEHALVHGSKLVKARGGQIHFG